MANVPADGSSSTIETEVPRSISPPAIGASLAVIAFLLLTTATSRGGSSSEPDTKRSLSRLIVSALMVAITFALSPVLGSRGSSDPMPKASPSISPATISAFMAVITFALSAGWYSVLYIQNWERDRATASMNVCRDFAFGEGRRASDAFNEASRYLDKDENRYRNKPFKSGLFGRAKPDEDVRNALLTLVNMIDVTATGLDTGVYEPKIIASCLSLNFSVITEALLQSPNSFVEMTGHERIPIWSARLEELAQVPPEQSSFWRLF